ncbi:MAG: hypothetical protein QOE29_2461 [Gaiellaceae bacterium]|nr:hypothetical protein [Gaiellaceae bacterium]
MEQRRERYARAVTAVREGLAEGRPEVRARLVLVALHERLRAGASTPEERLDVAATLVEPRLPGKRFEDYGRLVDRVCARATELLPQGAHVLVVSRGDTALLQLKGLHAGHFPQDESGEWAGFYPPDSETAIAHLEQLRAAGAEFLLFPATAVWWLEYYERLSAHLLTRAFVLEHGEACVIFDLRDNAEGSPARS